MENKTVQPLERQKSVLDLNGYIDSVVKQNMYKLVFGALMCWDNDRQVRDPHVSTISSWATVGRIDL